MNQIRMSIVSQLQAFAQEAGFTDCVIGLSGGLDSSVVAALCTEAYGPEHVHGVLLPGPYSSDHSREDALALANNLGLETDIIPITEPYQAFARELELYLGDDFQGVASENTQARCRMVVLMALSNARGWMLVNTGNRSEAYRGYSTLYGDTAGAFAPIGSLYKTQVFELARQMNAQAREAGQVAPIPQHVIDKPPSAELAPNQTDEAGLGIGYEELDRILAGYYDKGQGIEELASKETDVAHVASIIARAQRYAYKRTQLPPAAVLP